MYLWRKTLPYNQIWKRVARIFFSVPSIHLEIAYRNPLFDRRKKLKTQLISFVLTIPVIPSTNISGDLQAGTMIAAALPPASVPLVYRHIYPRRDPGLRITVAIDNLRVKFIFHVIYSVMKCKLMSFGPFVKK